jgi:hypothetical protein
MRPGDRYRLSTDLSPVLGDNPCPISCVRARLVKAGRGKYKGPTRSPVFPSINTGRGAEDSKVKKATLRIPEKIYHIGVYATCEARHGDSGDTTSSSYICPELGSASLPRI